MRTEHLVESARMWTDSNGAQGAWLARAELGRTSANMAPDFLKLSALRDSDSLAKLFTVGWRLDYQWPLVRWLQDICDTHLRGAGELPTLGAPVPPAIRDYFF